MFASSAHAISLRELVNATPKAELTNIFYCDYKEVTGDEVFTCFEILLNKVNYRVLVDGEFEVRYVLTLKSEKYPDGVVPVEDLMLDGAI